MWCLGVCGFQKFVCLSLLRHGLTYVALPGLELALSGWPQIHRNLPVSALLDTLDQYCRKCCLDCTALVTRVEPLITVSEIGIFSVIGQCL